MRNDDLEATLPDHLFRWLEAAQRRLMTELSEAAERTLPNGVRPGARRVLSMVGSQGIRLTDLATLSHMTKQAAGEYVDTLEAARLVTSGTAEGDRRVRLIRRTPAGDRLVAESERSIADVEARLRAEVGARRYDEMLRALRVIGAGALGR